MINVHTHIFTIQHVPVRFLPPWLKFIANLIVKQWLVNLFKKVGFRDLAYLLNRFYNFKRIGEKGTQEEIFKHLAGFYPSNTKLVALSMDMEFMGAGKVTEHFTSQLDGLSRIKQTYPTKEHPYALLPFVFAHPERPDVFDIVKKYIEEHDFSGIKIYPAIGYFPHDPRLEQVYQYAEQYEIPIMTHCTRGGVYYKGKLTEERRTDPRSGKIYPLMSNSKFTDCYSDPDRYIELLNDFPKLKVCFAHFGGANEWDKFLQESWHEEASKSWFHKVIEMVNNEDWNAFTDVSYTLCDPKYYATLKSFLISNKRLRERVLFGTDYYMTEQEISERSFGINLRGFLGEELWKQIAEENPSKYLSRL